MLQLPSIIYYSPWDIDPSRFPSRMFVDGKELWPDSEDSNRAKSTCVFCWATSCNNCWLNRRDVGRVISTDTLSDDVLLAMFDFCADEYQDTKEERGVAVTGTPCVCRRWRTIVFGSPRHLNLRLVCTENTPVRDTLEVWPPFPLVTHTSLSEGVGDIVAVLEHRDRVDRIYFSRADHSALETVLAAMLEPFPDLRVLSRDETLPVVPDSFLGGSAPRLRVFALSGITFPGLPKLLLSTTRLVYLRLSDIRILFT